MKKIFTLTAALLLTASLLAADRRPVILLNNTKNFKVVIDGKNYFGDHITIRPDYFYNGHHTVRVYEMRRGFFGRTERLLDAVSFTMDRDDIVIRIDYTGNILVREDYRNYGHSQKNRHKRHERHDHEYGDRDDFVNRF
ncbi:MAG: hypothetical protein HYZ15_03460 [Sphingobacteriales bacterium]|nr:hypothetical protein [Sphingobacteriales bacterium]